WWLSPVAGRADLDVRIHDELREGPMLLAVRATLRGVFTLFVQVPDAVLINEEIRAAVTRELDAIPVVPFDRAAKDFAVRQNHRDGRARLHLLHVIEIFRVRLLRGSRFLTHGLRHLRCRL